MRAITHVQANVAAGEADAGPGELARIAVTTLEGIAIDIELTDRGKLVRFYLSVVFFSSSFFSLCVCVCVRTNVVAPPPVHTRAAPIKTPHAVVMGGPWMGCNPWWTGTDPAV